MFRAAASTQLSFHISRIQDSGKNHALTTMRNALAIVFSSEARETQAMPEDAPSDDAAPITPSDVPEISPTPTPSDLSQSLSRTFI